MADTRLDLEKVKKQADFACFNSLCMLLLGGSWDVRVSGLVL